MAEQCQKIETRRAGAGTALRLGPILFAFALFVLPHRSLGQAKFSTSLDRDTIMAGETVTLSLTFEGVQPQGMPTLPNIPGLRQAGSVSTSMNTSFVNGQSSSSVSYNVALQAEQPGEYTIPQFTVEIGGQRLQSAPLKLKVQSAAASAPGAAGTNQLAFLTLTLPKKELYLGEVLVPELRLYVRADLRFSDAQIPPLRGDGFTSGQFLQGQNFSKQINGAMYTVIPVTTALTPVKTGQLSINAINGSVVVHVPSQGARRRLDPFDIESFFGGGTSPVQVPLAVEQQNLTVLAVPSENVPAGFSGAVGNFTMEYSAGPTNVAVGEPITVNVRISGRGNFDGLNLPEQPAWHDFKSYPPKVEFKPQDKFGVVGTKTFEQVISPESADVKELPGFAFSFFNPEKKSYETLSQPALPLTVRATASAAPSVAASRQNQNQNENQPPAQDIVPIKDRLGVVAQAAPPLVEQPWFLALQGMPIFAFAGAFAWRRRNEALANNPRLRRQKLVDHVVQEGLGTLRRLAAENRSDDFFATLFRLLQERLGERLNVPATAITEAVIEESLRPRGAPDSVLQPLHELFQTCNLARYAPIKSSQELAALVPKTEQVLEQLRGLKLH